MKKLLLLSIFILAINIEAQYNYTGDFEEGLPELYHSIAAVGFSSISNQGPCSGTKGGQLTLSSSTTQVAWMMRLDKLETLIPGQTNNYQSATVSFKYKKAFASAGQLYVAYMIKHDSYDNWKVVPIGEPVNIGTENIQNCQQISATIPTGLLKEGKKFAVGAYYKQTNTPSSNSLLFIDDISIVQEVVNTVPSNCSAITYPSGTDVRYGKSLITWNSVEKATGYHLTVGTTPDGNETFSGDVFGETSAFVNTVANTKYYVKAVPFNLNGSAIDCNNYSTFTTSNKQEYCQVMVAVNVNPISNVTFAGINNQTPTFVGYTSGYEPHMPLVANVERNNTYPISIKGTTNGSYRDGIVVYIDWNQNGILNDEGEAYFTTSGQIYLTNNAGATNSSSANGNIKVPENAALGETRMRIKKANIGGISTPANTANYTSANLLNPCLDLSHGEIEDYTVRVVPQGTLNISDVKKESITIYPNPFKDNIKLSNIKELRSIIINDITGRQIKTLSPSTEINLSSLNPGVYIINLQMIDGTSKSFKSIKK